MPTSSDVEFFLSQAGEREKEYDWSGAAELYEKAIGLVPETDFLNLGHVQERMGYAFYRAAMQAESQEEFKTWVRQAVADYEKAREFYGKISEPGKSARMLRCDAVVAFFGYWLASEANEKKRLLDECWRLAKEALKALDEAGEAYEYGRTYRQLASSAFLGYALEWDFQKGEKTIREAMEHGERAIALLSGVGDANELARVYVKAAFYLMTFSYYFMPDMDERQRPLQKGLIYLQKASELSEEATLLELSSTSGGSGDELGWGPLEIVVNFEKASACAKKTRDKYLIGTAMDWLAYATMWKVSGIEDPDRRFETLQKALQYAEDAKHSFSSISFTSPRGDALWTGAPYCHYYQALAVYETDLSKRRALLEKAVTDGTNAIKQAEDTGYPGIMRYAHFFLIRALTLLAQMEMNLEEKKRLLEKALEHGVKSEKIGEQRYPFSYWNQGLGLNFVASLKATLSDIEKDSAKKKSMLEEAVLDSERGLQLCIKESMYMTKRGELSFFAVLGLLQYGYGESLNRLHKLTNNNVHQRKAVKAFEDAAESFKKLNLVSRVAECYWKVARGYDALDEHLRAAENFNQASTSYANAAEKIPQLKDFYQDHAFYMEAWSEIEKARYYHVRQEYGSAKEHFEKAADLHKALKLWSYLMPNYLAWAAVEQAEDLSRKEQSEDAIQAFEQAAKLFNETKKSLQTQLDKIEKPDEKQMATDMVKATDERREYCIGRIALEEAKILDKKGDHYSSSQKYGSATQIFEEITDRLEPEQDRKEFRLIITLSKAWQKMMLAEARASPQLYMEASQLFEEASECSSSEKTSFLTLGHSRFCRALEAGTKFIDTRDAALHAVVIQHLGSAADYYVKAGFQNASEYAKATKLLFDAYVHMGNAERETDPEKKAKLYTMAEKVLQTSAGSFMKAEHPEKREQVLRLLEKVKEERELAISLAEVLHAPTIVSTTMVFSAPTPTHENAVGLERFEHADIQANLVTRQKELKVGENLNLEIELVNAGKGPALLIKVTELIPEGFELTEKPETYRVEDSYLNMKGKRLDPLKTEEVRLVLKPKAQGTFPLKPKILYLDEDGKYKSHEPEPITITVKELGIKGWIKGER